MKTLLAFLLLSPILTHAADIPFTLDRPGNVSAAIYDAQGRMLRELARAVPMTAGQHTLVWDGLDRHGVATAPGAYTWTFSAPRDDTARASCGNGAKANSYHLRSKALSREFMHDLLSLPGSWFRNASPQVFTKAGLYALLTFWFDVGPI